MSLRSAKYVNNNTEAHVKELNKRGMARAMQENPAKAMAETKAKRRTNR
jgi:hypothetical protein